MATRKSEWLASIKPILDRDEAKKDAKELARELGDILEINIDANPENLKQLTDEFNKQLSKMGKQPIVFSENTLQGIVNQFADAIASGFDKGLRGIDADPGFGIEIGNKIGRGISEGISRGVDDAIAKLSEQLDSLKKERAKLTSEQSRVKSHLEYNTEENKAIMDFNPMTAEPLTVPADIQALRDMARQVREEFEDAYYAMVDAEESGADAYMEAVIKAKEKHNRMWQMNGELTSRQGNVVLSDEISSYDDMLFGDTGEGVAFDTVFEEISDKMEESRQRLDAVSRQLRQINTQITSITNQIVELNSQSVKSNSAETTLKTLQEIEAAYDRISKKKITKGGHKPIDKVTDALEYTPGDASLATLRNRYTTSLSSGADWEEQYQWLVKFVKEYEASLVRINAEENKIDKKNHLATLNKYTELYNSLKPLASGAEASLFEVAKKAGYQSDKVTGSAGSVDISDTDVAQKAREEAEKKAEAEKRAEESSEQQRIEEEKIANAKAKQRLEDEKIAEAKRKAAEGAERERQAGMSATNGADGDSTSHKQTTLYDIAQGINGKEKFAYLNTDTGKISEYIEGGYEGVAKTAMKELLSAINETMNATIHSHPEGLAAPSEEDVQSFVDDIDRFKRNFILAGKQLAEIDFSELTREQAQKIADVYKVNVSNTEDERYERLMMSPMKELGISSVDSDRVFAAVSEQLKVRFPALLSDIDAYIERLRALFTATPIIDLAQGELENVISDEVESDFKNQDRNQQSDIYEITKELIDNVTGIPAMYQQELQNIFKQTIEYLDFDASKIFKLYDVDDFQANLDAAYGRTTEGVVPACDEADIHRKNADAINTEAEAQAKLNEAKASVVANNAKAIQSYEELNGVLQEYLDLGKQKQRFEYTDEDYKWDALLKYYRVPDSDDEIKGDFDTQWTRVSNIKNAIKNGYDSYLDPETKSSETLRDSTLDEETKTLKSIALAYVHNVDANLELLNKTQRKFVDGIISEYNAWETDFEKRKAPYNEHNDPIENRQFEIESQISNAAPIEKYGDISRIFENAEWLGAFNATAVEQLAQYLGIEVPNAAKTATTSVDGLNDSLAQTEQLEQKLSTGGAAADGAPSDDTDGLRQQLEAKDAEITQIRETSEAQLEAANNEKVTLQNDLDFARQQAESAQDEAAASRAREAEISKKLAEQEALNRQLRESLANVKTVGGDEQVSVSSEELKNVLGSITYSVKIVHDDNDKQANKIAIDESTLENTLKRVFARGLNPQIEQADPEPKNEPWALEKTLQTVKSVLDTIQTNTAKPEAVEIAPAKTDIGNVLATENTLAAIKAAVEAINNKILGKISGVVKSESGESVKTPAERKKYKDGTISHGQAEGSPHSMQKLFDYYYWIEEQIEQFKNNKLYVSALQNVQSEIAPKLIDYYDRLEKSGEEYPAWMAPLDEKHNLHMSKIRGEEAQSDSASIEKKTLDILKEEYKLRKEIFGLKQKGATSDDVAPLQEMLGIYQSIRETLEFNMTDDELLRYTTAATKEVNKGEHQLSIKQIIANIQARKAEDKETGAAYKELIELQKTRNELELKHAKAQEGSAAKQFYAEQLAQMDQAIARQRVIIDNDEYELKLAKMQEAQARKLGEAEAQAADKDAKKQAADAKKMAQRGAMLGKAGNAVGRAENTWMNAIGIEGELPADFAAEIDEYYQKLDALRKKHQELKNSDMISYEQKKELIAQTLEINKLTDEIGGLVSEYQKLSGDNVTVIGKDKLDSDAGLDAYNQQLKQAVMTATNGKAQIKNFDAATGTLTYTVKTGAHEFTEYTAAVRHADGALVSVQGATKKTETFFEATARKMKELTSYFSGMAVFNFAKQEFKRGIQYIREIDLALTELKKVTNETEQTYDKFLKTAAKTADKLGSTMQEVISSTADFSRVGYTLEQSATLAESALTLMNTSEYTDIGSASEALISALKAYGYAAEESMHVVDIFNEIGENYCRCA